MAQTLPLTQSVRNNVEGENLENRRLQGHDLNTVQPRLKIAPPEKLIPGDSLDFNCMLLYIYTRSNLNPSWGTTPHIRLLFFAL